MRIRKVRAKSWAQKEIKIPDIFNLRTDPPETIYAVTKAAERSLFGRIDLSAYSQETPDSYYFDVLEEKPDAGYYLDVPVEKVAKYLRGLLSVYEDLGGLPVRASDKQNVIRTGCAAAAMYGVIAVDGRKMRVPKKVTFERNGIEYTAPYKLLDTVNENVFVSILTEVPVEVLQTIDGNPNLKVGDIVFGRTRIYGYKKKPVQVISVPKGIKLPEEEEKPKEEKSQETPEQPQVTATQ